MEELKQLELRKLELDIQLKEIEIKERLSTIKTKNKINQSILIAIVGSALGIIGTLFNSWFQSSNERDIEKQKLNSSLILKAVETDNRSKSVETLKFLLSLKLISDDDNILKDILSDSSKVNIVPAVFEKQYLITITDSSKSPINGVDVFYNQIFVGKTNVIGQVTVGFSLKDTNESEIEVKKNGMEYGYIDISADRFDNITLRVVPKK